MIPRAYFLLAVVTAIAGSSARADDVKTVELLPHWKQGNTARYKLTRTQTREMGGKVEWKSVARTAIAVEVVSANEDGFILRWAQGSAMFDDPKAGNEPLVKTMNVILKSVELDLEIGTDGALRGLHNWKELKGTGLKMRDVALSGLAKAGVAKSALDTIRKDTTPMFATKESLEAAFTQQPALLVYPLGQTYTAGMPVEYDDELPNPYPGGDPIPTQGEFSLKEIDATAGLIRVVYKQTPDPKELNSIIENTIRALAKKMGKPAPEVFPEFKMSDMIECEVDLKTGWVKSVTHTRTTSAGDTTQAEIITLILKE